MHRRTLLAAAASAAVARVGFAAKTPALVPADVATIKAAVARRGARAVLLNVWASWCEPCKEEMPDILRVHRKYERQGLRLILVSGDFQESREDAARFLGSLGVDFPTFLKTGDDQKFIDGLEPRWTGTLPVTLLYDGNGVTKHFWPEKVTYAALDQKLAEILKTKQQEPRKRRQR